ncbi:MAG: hypothetical protein ACFFB7_06710 [Candidatus Sifarchaeia archaeon]
MRIAGRDINLRFWVKTFLKVSLLFLIPEYVFVEVDARLPGLEGYGGNYNCMLFAVFVLHYSGEVFITMRTPVTILAAVSICVPGIYFTRRLASQPRTTPIKDTALASGFATAFAAMYCVYGNSLDYSLLNMGSLALLVLVILPIFLREAELVGLSRVLTEQDGYGATDGPPVSAPRVPLKYTIAGAFLALAALLTPHFLLVQTSDYLGLLEYQAFTLLNAPAFAYSGLAPYWRFGIGIIGIDYLFLMLFVFGVRILFTFGILRYWRGMMSKTIVLLTGAIGFLVPALSFQLMETISLYGTRVFSSPLPILFLAGLLAILSIKPTYVENLQILESMTEEAVDRKKLEDLQQTVAVPIFYALRSRTILALSRLRRGRADDESESEE